VQFPPNRGGWRWAFCFCARREDRRQDNVNRDGLIQLNLFFHTLFFHTLFFSNMEEAMKTNRSGKENETRIELKYCEHCGGLWLRECGGGEVYCEACRPVVEELPVPKKRPGRVTLPEARPALVDRYRIDDIDAMAARNTRGVA
jgi:hypothetical protein